MEMWTDTLVTNQLNKFLSFTKWPIKVLIAYLTGFIEEEELFMQKMTCEFLVWNSFDAKIYEPKKRRPLITSLRRGEAIKMRKEIIEEKEYKNV